MSQNIADIMNYFQINRNQNEKLYDDLLTVTGKIAEKYNRKKNELNRFKSLNKLEKPTGSYETDINYTKNNLKIPNLDQFTTLEETIRDLVQKNWNGEYIHKRLTYSSKSYKLLSPGVIDTNFDDIKIPELLTLNTTYTLPEPGDDDTKNIGKINLGIDRQTEVFVINDNDDTYTKRSKNGELKRFLSDIATDFNVINFSSNYELRLIFIAIWLKAFEIFFDEIYNLDPTLNKENLNIMFKGGVTLRAILYTAFVDFNIIEERNIYNDIKKQTKISDFDFELVSDATVCDWKILNKINMLTFFLIIETNDYIEQNLDKFYNFFKYSKKVKTELGSELLEKVKKEVSNRKRTQQEYKNSLDEEGQRNFNKYDDYYANIEPLFIELETFNNLSSNVYSDDIKKIIEKHGRDILEDNGLDKVPVNIKNNNLGMLIEKLYEKFPLTTGDREHDKRKHFGLITDGSNSAPRQQGRPENFVDRSSPVGIVKSDKIKEIYKINFKTFKERIEEKNQSTGVINNYNFYTTHNPNVFIETDNGALIDFQLNRIKYNYVLFYKIQNPDGDYDFYRVNMAGEVFDLSHAGNRDRKKQKSEIAYNDNKYFNYFSFLGYKYPDEVWSSGNDNISYLGYSSYGHISDMEVIIFDETAYKPWSDLKYGKRIKRIFLVACMDLFLKNKYKKYNYTKRLELFKKLINNFKIGNFTSTFEDEFKILNLLNDRLSKVNKDLAEYPDFKNTVINIMDSMYNIYLQRFMEPKLLTYDKNIEIDFDVLNIRDLSIYG